MMLAPLLVTTKRLDKLNTVEAQTGNNNQVNGTNAINKQMQKTNKPKGWTT